MTDTELRAIAEAANKTGAGHGPDALQKHILTFDPPTVIALLDRILTLQMLLARYGDRVRMATASAWQQEIDDALAGRCSKCGGLHAGNSCLPPVPTRPLSQTPIA